MFRASIRYKLMGLLLAATIIPIVTSILFSYSYTKQSVTEESIRENLNLLALGSSNIQSYLNNINQTSLSVYHSLHAPNSLYRIIERGTGGTEDLAAQEFSNSRQIHNHLLVMQQSERAIDQIYLQIFNNRQSYLKTRSSFRSYQKETIEWPVGAVHGSRLPFLEPTHQSTDYNVAGASFSLPTPVITLHRPIIRTPSDEVIGFLSIDVRVEEMFELFRQLTVPGKESLFVIDADNRVVYAEDPELYGTTLSQEWVHKLHEGAARGYFAWEEAAYSGMMMYDTLSTEYMSWTLVKQVPYSSLYENANRIAQINTYILLTFLVIIIVATLFISLHFTYPIKRLISHMNQVQAGNLNLEIKVKGNDEFAILTRRFDTMIHRINELINREYKLELANMTNQLKAMQMQINPHFLYNALQSIGTLSLQLGAPKVYSLLSSLARMMRYNMNANDAIVPLSTEINHVKSYLELQQQRFGEKLNVHIQVQEDAASVLVPKMLLQPIVENYFKHGYEHQGGNGSIRITAERADSNWLHIEVKDYGAGMEPDKLNALQQLLSRPSSTLMNGDESIGLRNVLLRLRLYYNDNAQLHIRNDKDGGFVVTIQIPILQGGEGDEGIDR